MSTAPDPLPPVVTTQTQKTPTEWFDTVMRAATPLILAYIAAVGAGTKPEDPKDRFTIVVAAAVADGEFDLARRLIDAVDPPKENGGGK